MHVQHAAALIAHNLDAPILVQVLRLDAARHLVQHRVRHAQRRLQQHRVRNVHHQLSVRKADLFQFARALKDDRHAVRLAQRTHDRQRRADAEHELPNVAQRVVERVKEVEQGADAHHHGVAREQHRNVGRQRANLAQVPLRVPRAR